MFAVFSFGRMSVFRGRQNIKLARRIFLLLASVTASFSQWEATEKFKNFLFSFLWYHRKTMPDSCCAYGCTNRREDNGDRAFYRFPRGKKEE